MKIKYSIAKLMGYRANVVLKINFIAINVYIIKKENSQVNNLIFYLILRLEK